jgi:signal peptidase I
MPDATAHTSPARPAEQTSVKETLISITIAFAMAFVFRAFVIEAYVIPTGSMAPTLMGQHMRLQAPETGYTWPVNPWQMKDPAGQIYEPVQRGIIVHDPMSGARVGPADVPRRSGDRILVLKYLRHVFEASRFDVVVFKAPHDPQTNFIKRLLGMPGEQVALIDGDVFARTPRESDPTGPDVDTWSLDGWQIKRKPERVQREVWQPLFDSAWTPDKPDRDGRPWFTSPWTGGGDAAWKIAGNSSYRHDSAAPARLDWDAQRHPIEDRYPYNEERDPSGRPVRYEEMPKFPVSDLRLSLGLEPESPGMTVAAVIRARRHEFRALISGAQASLQMRPQDSTGDTGWETLATGSLPGPLPAGKVTDIDFWHVDQHLDLRVDGALVATAPYDWTPAQRVQAAMGMSLAEALHTSAADGNIFAETRRFQPPEPHWEFSGGPFTIHRVALARDLHYLASVYVRNGSGGTHSRAGTPANTTHPYATPTLSPDQFFTCGDNSPASLDARLWDNPDPFVAEEIDPTMGVVPRALMLGKAFFVYFPSTTQVFGYRVLPDFGRLRWIW